VVRAVLLETDCKDLVFSLIAREGAPSQWRSRGQLATNYPLDRNRAILHLGSGTITVPGPPRTVVTVPEMWQRNTEIRWQLLTTTQAGGGSCWLNVDLVVTPVR
jgi:hypothetical protein